MKAYIIFEESFDGVHGPPDETVLYVPGKFAIRCAGTFLAGKYSLDDDIPKLDELLNNARNGKESGKSFFDPVPLIKREIEIDDMLARQILDLAKENREAEKKYDKSQKNLADKVKILFSD